MFVNVLLTRIVFKILMQPYHTGSLQIAFSRKREMLEISPIQRVSIRLSWSLHVNSTLFCKWALTRPDVLFLLMYLFKNCSPVFKITNGAAVTGQSFASRTHVCSKFSVRKVLKARSPNPRAGALRCRWPWWHSQGLLTFSVLKKNCQAYSNIVSINNQLIHLYTF